MTPFSEELWKTFQKTLGLKESPLGAYYTDDKPDGITPKPGTRVCMIGHLQSARKKGKTVYFDREHFGCPGGAYYMGFFSAPMPSIEYFLSCGIPGQMEGERYVKTPDLAKQYVENMKPASAPASFCVFKPIEQFDENGIRPEVVIFFTSADLLSGLYTLTNYALERQEGVYAPFGSGCSTILTRPLQEARKEQPRAILGMFDVSARPMVERDVLTLAMPYSVFLKLLENVSGSFLQTGSWKKVLRRIKKD